MQKSTLINLVAPVSISILATGVAISAQDKYSLQVQNGLAFSEFRGYEDWAVIAISENEGVIAVILGNPAMIGAYRDGVPGNGKPFPDGAKMAKIHWIPKKQEAYPGQPTVPGAQHDVDFMVKDSKNSHPDNKLWGDGWGWALFKADAPAKNVAVSYEADCMGCHVPAAKTDRVFIQGYPTLTQH